MDYQIEMNEQAAQPVLFMRIRTSADKLPQALGQIYGAVIRYLNELGAEPENVVFAAYHNLDMDDLDLEAGFIVKKPLPGKGDINAGEIPAGKQVSCFHKGSYSGVKPVYDAMTQWMEKHNCTPTGVAYEFYYNSPAEVPESELLTKIMFPLFPDR